MVLVFVLTGAAESPGASGPDGLGVELAAARSEVAALRESAGEKIARYEEERARLAELTGARDAAERAAENAGERHQDSRLGAARQAASAYKGGDLSLLHAWTGPEGPAEALERGAYLHLFGKHREADLDRAEASRIVTGTLADAAGSAEREQAEATETAAAAREAAEEAIAEQEELAQELLGRQSALEEAMARTRDRGREDRLREEALSNARTATGVEENEAAAAEPAGETEDPAAAEGEPAPDRRKAAEGESTQATGSAGPCAGEGSGGFGNGRIPDAALCPLPQPGERLRPDAAAAFIELDGAFRSEFDRPMCVTDSYRPYHEQVRLFQEMLPGMAAEPGTSAHGLGVAVDLCGGVEVLGSAEHRWMLDHGPDHGWDNPEWARNGFEPWHWEFTP